MKLTNYYSRVALRLRTVDARCSKEEDEDERVESEKKGKPVNPWAVCHESVGPEKSEKFEHCVQDVKKKSPIKKS